jgi:hypothetical protein
MATVPCQAGEIRVKKLGKAAVGTSAPLREMLAAETSAPLREMLAAETSAPLREMMEVA